MGNWYLSTSHHFALTAPAADTASGLAVDDVIGFTCIPDKDKGNAPFYKEIDGQYLVNLFSNAQADQTAKNPEEDLPINLSDYRSGFGMDIQDYSDPKRYFASYGVDLRFKDKAILSYGATAIAPPAADSQTYIDPTSTNDPSSTWTNDANAIDGNDATSATASVDAAQYTGFLEAHIVNTNISSVQVKADISGTSNEIDIDAYYNGAWNGVHDGTWTEGTTQAFSLGAAYGVTAVRVRIKNTQGGAETANIYLIQLLRVAATVGYPTAHATFNDLEYVAFGKYLVKMNGTGNGWTRIHTFGVDVTDMAVMTISNTDYLFIALGYSDAYVYMTTAEALTTSTATNNLYKFLKVVYTTAATMYGNDTNSTIRSTTNPLNGGTAWSAQTQVGVDFYDILDLFTTSGALYIRKEDMPYYLNSSGAVQNDLAPECEPMAASTTGRAVTVWLNEVHYVAGLSSLVRIGTTNSWISPSEYCTNLGAFTGQIFALTGDDRYLWAVVDNSTKVEVMCGRDEDVDGTTAWRWHSYQEITLTGCNIAWVSSVYQKRLWIASNTNGESLYYIPLPVNYGNVPSDTNRSFPISATAYYFETPFLHGKFPADTKGWIKVVATLGHAYDADIYWTIQYEKLEDSSYTNIGNLVGTSTNRTHTLYLPVDASSNNPVSPLMRFKLIGVTDVATKTPELLNLYIGAILYPTKKDIIWAKVKIAKQMSTKGGTSRDKYAKMKACLDVSRDATYPVTMKDIDGNTIQVRFLQLPQSLPWREPVTDEVKRDYDYIYNLLMLRTPTS